MKYFSSLSDAQWSAPMGSPGIPMRWDLSKPPRKHPTILGKLYVHLGFSFSLQKNYRLRGPISIWDYAGLGEGLCTPGSGIFTTVTCLWIAVSWTSRGRGRLKLGTPMAPSWWCHSPEINVVSPETVLSGVFHTASLNKVHSLIPKSYCNGRESPLLSQKSISVLPLLDLCSTRRWRGIWFTHKTQGSSPILFS